MKVNTTFVISAIFGVVLIFYLIANTFNDASDEITAISETAINLDNVSETVKGAKFIMMLKHKRI